MEVGVIALDGKPGDKMDDPHAAQGRDKFQRLLIELTESVIAL